MRKFFLIWILCWQCQAWGDESALFPLSSAELGDAGPFVPVKFGNGIEFRNDKAVFLMNLRFRMQNLAEYSFPDQPAANQDSGVFNWHVRRLRLRMNGHALSPRLNYLVQLSFSKRDQDWDATEFSNIVRDAMITYKLDSNWSVGFGQGKLPGNRQRVISSGDQQFTDRSIVNGRFNLDRDFGFQLKYQKDYFDWGFAISSGEGRNQSIPPDNKLFYVNRIEWLPWGKFDRQGDYFESDLAFEQTFKGSIGYSAAYLDGAARSNGSVGEIFTSTGNVGDPVVRRSLWVHYVDALFKFQGFSSYLEWARRDLKDPIINNQQAFLLGQGISAQLGKMLDDSQELALRYSSLLPEESVRSFYSEDRLWSLVYNHFLRGHRIKLQGEIGRYEAGENYVRLQMELGI